MTSGLVSVVVPTYNRAYCVRRTIDSALAQTYGNLEVVVVDDGSTDGTAELIRQAYGGEARVRYHSKPNGGVSTARNRGIALARGEYVAFLDSDDAFKPWKLQVQVACLERNPEVGMVWTDMEAVDPKGRVFNPKHLRTMYWAYRWWPRAEQLFTGRRPLAEVAPDVPGVPPGGTFYTGDIFSAMVMGNLVHTSTVVLRKAWADRVGRFNEADDWRLGEDYDYHLRTCRQGPVGFIDLPSIEFVRGLTDHITIRHAELSSVNFLRTVTRTLKEDRDRVALPRWMVRAVLAEANAWVGETRDKQGDGRAARRHLARSLLYRPWQPRTLAMLALCCLPPGVARRLQGLYRLLKRPLKGTARADAGRLATPESG